MLLYRSFRIQLILRLVLIILLGCASWYIATQTSFWLVALWTGLLLLGVFWELVRYIERNHRALDQFVAAIGQNDFSQSFVNKADHTQTTKHAYERILTTFRALRSQKESQHQLLQQVVEQVSQAMICYTESEEIVLMNQAAKNLFQRRHAHQLQGLDKTSPQLADLIRNLPVGQQQLHKYWQGGRWYYLAVQATHFKLLAEPHKLISFQDISAEMDAQEVNSWQKLIRVLTHEISNSVIPISTLSALAEQTLEEASGSGTPTTLTEEETEDLIGSFHTISSRARGLANFVQTYRSLTELSRSSLHIAEVDLLQLVKRVQTLLKPQMDQKGIDLQITNLLKNPLVSIDLERMEQVLINLLLNAMDAVEGVVHPAIELKLERNDKGQSLLHVSDNGKGISEKELEQIFVPFFTTKEKGSGIGLSLARQIMHMHQGSIQVSSELEKGSVFTLRF